MRAIQKKLADGAEIGRRTCILAYAREAETMPRQFDQESFVVHGQRFLPGY